MSLRRLSAVLKIATRTTAEHEAGEIVWRFGGRLSVFTFDDPDESGPCAQHSASELPNGNILVFDNGSGGSTPSLCINPDDPGGDPLPRTASRVTEWRITPPSAGGKGHADKVWEYAPGIYGSNRGSAQRLPGGHTLVGWDVPGGPLAQEVTADSPARVVYELRARADSSGRSWSTYRAAAVAPRDAVGPEIGFRSLADGQEFLQGSTLIADYYCRDRGGSGLISCGGSYRPGDVVDTTQLGTHSYELVAEDAAGNRTTLQRRYRVVPPADEPEPQIPGRPGPDPESTESSPSPPAAGPGSGQPDVAVKIRGGGWEGRGVFGSARNQRIRVKLKSGKPRTRARLRIANAGSEPARFKISGRKSSAPFVVRYRTGGDGVTRRVTRGRFKTPRLMSCPGFR